MSTVGNRTGAIWARVSGPEQQSLPSQVAEVKEWLESQGYVVPAERILAVDWTSTDILRCPQMQQLLHWVANKEVDAVGSVHLDRFAARPGQVAQIFDTFKQSDVQLLLKQTPLPTGLMGELIGLVITMGKALSVERAEAGAKRGLHDRPKIHRVPVTYRKPYGYRWEENPLRLVPDDNWDFACFICREGLAGTPSRTIQRKLRERPIPIFSPIGKREWCIQTIIGILKNPLYGGRFYALRREATEPHNRQQKNTYGKTSSAPVPFDRWEYLPEVEVVNPPLTWDEWLTVQRRLEQNKLLAQRNARFDYLLRGLIDCRAHNRKWRGVPYHKVWRYVCPIGEGCPGQHGPKLELHVKATIARLIISGSDDMLQPSEGRTEADLREELRRLEIKRSRVLNSLVELERRSIEAKSDDEKIDNEVYVRLKPQYQAKLQWVTEETERINSQLGNLQRREEAINSLEELRGRLWGRLTEMTKQKWRDLFINLGLRVRIHQNGFPIICLGIPLKNFAIPLKYMPKAVLSSP